MARLTTSLRETLLVLDGCTAPWDALWPPNIRALRKLKAVGYSDETLDGWVITDAGRAALEAEHIILGPDGHFRLEADKP